MQREIIQSPFKMQPQVFNFCFSHGKQYQATAGGQLPCAWNMEYTGRLRISETSWTLLQRFRREKGWP